VVLAQLARFTKTFQTYIIIRQSKPKPSTPLDSPVRCGLIEQPPHPPPLELPGFWGSAVLQSPKPQDPCYPPAKPDARLQKNDIGA
jgi:hypothetical protein